MPQGDPPTRFPRKAARRTEVNDSVQVVQDNLDRMKDHYDKHGPHGGAMEWEDVGTDTPGGGSGIQFDTYPQAGGWLFAETTDATTSPSAGKWAIELHDSSGGSIGGIWLHSDSHNILIVAGSSLSMSSPGGSFSVDYGGGAKVSSGSGIQLSVSNDVKYTLNDGSGTYSGLFGHLFTLPPSGGEFTVKDKGGGYVPNYLKITTGPGGDIEMNSPDQLNLYAKDGNLMMQGGIVQLASQNGPLNLVAQGNNDVRLFSANGGNVIILGHVIGDGGVQVPILKVTQNALGQPTYHIKSGASWVADL